MVSFALGEVDRRRRLDRAVWAGQAGKNRRSVDLAGFLRGQRPQLRKAWIVD